MEETPKFKLPPQRHLIPAFSKKYARPKRRRTTQHDIAEIQDRLLRKEQAVQSAEAHFMERQRSL